MIKIETTVIGTFEISGISDPAMMQAAMIGLRKHMRLQERSAISFLGGFTSQGAGYVAGKTKMWVTGGAGGAVGVIQVTDKPFGAGIRTGRSWTRGSAGATHRDWKGKLSKRTFIVRRWGGNIFSRLPKDPTTRAGRRKERFVKKIWGPVLRNELRKENRPNVPRMRALAERDALNTIMAEIARVMGGR